MRESGSRFDSLGRQPTDFCLSFFIPIDIFETPFTVQSDGKDAFGDWGITEQIKKLRG